MFITAHADGAAQSSALAQGAEAFFLKPFKPAALLEAVRTAVGKSTIDRRFRRNHDCS